MAELREGVVYVGLLRRVVPIYGLRTRMVRKNEMIMTMMQLLRHHLYDHVIEEQLFASPHT